VTKTIVGGGVVCFI